MNEITIIDRKLLAGLAKEVELNASHLEALGESRQWEIVVGGDILELLVEIQHQFERLAVLYQSASACVGRVGVNHCSLYWKELHISFVAFLEPQSFTSICI